MKANRKFIEADECAASVVFGVILIVVITVAIAAVGIYAYTNLVKKSETNPPPIVEPGKTLLTVRVGSQSYNYTLNELTAFASVSGQGGYIDQVGKIRGPNNYTGVAVSVLLSTIPSLPTNYTFHAIAGDGYTQDYSINAVNGHVIVFNEAGAEIGPGTLTMIVAYKENGVFLNENTKGPLRIAFVYPESVLTNSRLWLSSLIKIEII